MDNINVGNTVELITTSGIYKNYTGEYKVNSVGKYSVNIEIPGEENLNVPFKVIKKVIKNNINSVSPVAGEVKAEKDNERGGGKRRKKYSKKKKKSKKKSKSKRKRSKRR